MKRLPLIFISLILLTSCAGGASDWTAFAPKPEDRLVIYTSHKEAVYANLDGCVLADSGDVAAAVAGGQCTIGVTLEETALKAVESHSDVALLYPEEGTVCLPDGMAVVKNAPHEENARAFIDFCLGEDVQNYLQYFRRRPVRPDTGWTLSGVEEPRLLDYDLEWAARERETLLSRWRRLEEGTP